MELRRRLAFLMLVLALGALTACARSRPVFPPDMSIQQLRVDASGQWVLSLRMNNFSYEAGVHFGAARLELSVADTRAGSLDRDLGMQVAARSVEVVDVTLAPSAAARVALEKLGTEGGPGLAYALTGSVSVRDEKGTAERSFPIDHHDFLSPVPGVSGLYR